MRDAGIAMLVATAAASLLVVVSHLLLPADPTAVYFPVVPFYVPITPN